MSLQRKRHWNKWPAPSTIPNPAKLAEVDICFYSHKPPRRKTGGFLLCFIFPHAGKLFLKDRFRKKSTSVTYWLLFHKRFRLLVDQFKNSCIIKKISSLNDHKPFDFTFAVYIESMIATLKMFYTTVGRKLVMALTGLFLFLFLLEHLYGNLLLYKIDEGHAFNEYSEFMAGNIIIRIIEYALFAGFIIHIIDALFLTYNNRKARPTGYAVNHKSQNSSWFSRNMGLTGSIILFFLVIHLRTFFFPHRFGSPETSLAYDVANAFQANWYAALYLVSMVILGAHLNHGVQSSLQTLGLNNMKYRQPLKTTGTLLSLILMIGFASFPIIFYFDLFGIATNILEHR